jgi:hypothetical protein
MLHIWIWEEAALGCRVLQDTFAVAVCMYFQCWGGGGGHGVVYTNLLSQSYLYFCTFKVSMLGSGEGGVGSLHSCEDM